ncbi:hypothetical protein ACTVZO_07745 [Streptomyces sp. IBSNAI002]
MNYGKSERLQCVYGLVHDVLLLLDGQGGWRGVGVQPGAIGEPP